MQRSRLVGSQTMRRFVLAVAITTGLIVTGSSALNAASRQVGSDINGQAEDDTLGWSVDITADGTRLVTGIPGMNNGRARVMELRNGDWVQIGPDVIGQAGDRLGGSVAISPNGSRIVVGADSAYVSGSGWQTGKVRVYSMVNGIWTQIGQTLTGRAGSDYFGDAVAISADGTRVIVGAPQFNTADSRAGEVRVFDLVDDRWTQVGEDIDGPSDNSWFGEDVATNLAGNRIVVGASKHDAEGSFGDGAAQVLHLVAGEWQPLGDQLTGTAIFEELGRSVAMTDSGSRIVVGSEGSNDRGEVKVYDLDNGSWELVGAPVSDLSADDGFAWPNVAVSADGSRFAVGMHTNDEFAYAAGKVSVFDLGGEGEWRQVESSIYGRAEWDWLGRAVALSADGTRVAVGGNSDDAVARGAGQVRVFDLQMPTVICDGLEATIVGTPGNDVLTGSVHADVIAGLQGDDVIRGLDGDDIICGGKGNDIIYGGQGFDIIYGAQGDDEIFSADGDTTSSRVDTRGARMFGGAGDDDIHGSNRWDRMQGGTGTDRLNGYEGRDWMRGGADRDFLVGGDNIDDVHGGNGNDWIDVLGNDIVRGGAGAQDRCNLRTGSVPSPLISCELRGWPPLPTPDGVEGVDFIFVDFS